MSQTIEHFINKSYNIFCNHYYSNVCNQHHSQKDCKKNLSHIFLTFCDGVSTQYSRTLHSRHGSMYSTG